MWRYIWILLLCSLGQAAPINSIPSLHTALKNHQISCVQYTQQRIARILQFDLDSQRGAPINAVISLNPQAVQQARVLDAAQKKIGTVLKPLHCVPIILKDNINSSAIPSTSGSLALLGSQPLKDATVVKQLKENGAIIIGTAAMDEFSSGLIGKSSRSGRIGNAFNPNKNPGGSSGGSAVAVASDFAMIGLGTDNSGSIRVPAGFNGTFGLRPSPNRISKEGVFPRGSLNTDVGLISKNPKDLRRAFTILGKQACHYNPKKTYKIGMITSIDTQKINFVPYQKFLSQLKTINVKFVSVHIADFNHDKDHNNAGEVEGVNEYLRKFPSTRRNFSDICTSKRSLSFGSPKACLSYAKLNLKKNSTAYQNAQEIFLKNRQRLEKKMDDLGLDALLMPISALGVSTYNVQDIYAWQYPLASNSGLPALAIPIDYNPHGMPLSIQLIGRNNGEATLLNIAERWFNKHQPLRFPKLSNSNHDLRCLSISDFNNLKTAIGATTFQRFLKDNPKARVSAKQMVASLKNLDFNIKLQCP